MCELLAMSSRIPATVGITLERLARHGGLQGLNRDGWGVAFYEGRDAFVLREPRAAAQSALARYIEHSTPPSELVISHIRHATRGVPALQNTQPFRREMGGRVHIFAHNGDLLGIEDKIGALPVWLRPVGETDSELAFCELLHRLSNLWDETESDPPALSRRLQEITFFAADMRSIGVANFMYSDSDALFVHGHKRKQKDGKVSPPGLYVLERTCDRLSADLSKSGVSMASICDEMTLVASVPLSQAHWRPLHEGEVLIITRGKIIEQANH